MWHELTSPCVWLEVQLMAVSWCGTLLQWHQGSTPPWGVPRLHGATLHRKPSYLVSNPCVSTAAWLRHTHTHNHLRLFLLASGRPNKRQRLSATSDASPPASPPASQTASSSVATVAPAFVLESGHSAAVRNKPVVLLPNAARAVPARTLTVAPILCRWRMCRLIHTTPPPVSWSVWETTGDWCCGTLVAPLESGQCMW